MAWIRSQGSLCWKVDRPEPLEDTGRASTHISGTALVGYEGWDATIHNIGDLPHLYADVERVLKASPVGRIGRSHV